jgi:transposase
MSVEPEMADAGAGRARFQRPQRRQMTWQTQSLEQQPPDEHPARAVWAYVEGLDLAAFSAGIRAVEGAAGRAPIDPRILLSLWLLATIEGVGSARRLDKLCAMSLPYQWLCGGVGVNYHTLSDFRSEHAARLEELLTQSVALLLREGLVELTRVAQDGMRVRASAGSSSFRRRGTLDQYLAEAEAQVAALRAEAEQDDGAEDRRVRAARERAVRERAERVQRAVAAREELARQKEQRERGTGDQARASTTDPDARVMKMADGGFRPAYNVQLATTTDARVIVGVDVVQAGTDGRQLRPMVEQLQRRYGERPGEYLADGGFVNLQHLTELEAQQTRMYLPIMELDKKRAKGIDPYAPLPGDTPEVAAWRQRMGTPEAQTIYQERASSAEFSNAGCRNRGLLQFVVRGLAKVRAVVLWQALAHNLQRTWALRKAVLATS